MTRVLASAMVITMALALLSGVILFGAVDPDVAAPMYFLGLLAVALWAFKLLFSSAATWKPSPTHWPVLAFAGYALVRYFTSPVENDSRIELLYIGLFVLVYFTACQFYRPTDRTILIIALLALVAFESGYALWQYSTKTEKVLFWARNAGYVNRGGGTFICPNNFAAFLELAVGLILARGLMMHRRAGSAEAFAIQRLVLFYVALMGIIGIAVSLSRTGWVATVAGLVTLLALGDWRSRLQWGRIGAVAVALVLLAFVVWKLAPARVLNTFTAPDKGGNVALGFKEWTLNSRTYLWNATTPLIRENPVFGGGIGSWQWLSLKHKHVRVNTHPEYAHNEYLNLLADYGVVGFGLMLWVFAAFFRHASRLNDPGVPSDERSFVVGTLAGVAAVLVHAFFDFNLHIPANAFALALFMGCASAIEDPPQRHRRAPMPPWARFTLGAGLLALCALLGWQFARAAIAARQTRLGNDAKFLYFHIDPGIAFDHYQRAINAEPRYPMPYWKMGDTLRQQAQWRRGEEKKEERKQLALDASEYYATALRLNPYHTDVLLRAGAADELAGNDDAALKKYLRAVELEPNSSINHEIIARFYRDRNNVEQALKHYEAAAQLQHHYNRSIYDNIDELREQLGKKP